MSIAQLFNMPTNSFELAQWTLANAASHQFILVNLQKKNPGVMFASFVLDPIDERDVQNFLLRHQLMHNQFNQALNIPGNDYTELDPTHPGSYNIIWQQHANEHIEAEKQLLSGGS